MKKKIFIGNCAFDLDETSLREFVESQGVTATSVQIIRDRYTERSRGFGFIELDESQDLQGAIEALNGKEVEGRALTVNEAREQKPRFNDGGGFNSRGNGNKRGGGNRPSRW